MTLTSNNNNNWCSFRLDISKPVSVGLVQSTIEFATGASSPEHSVTLHYRLVSRRHYHLVHTKTNHGRYVHVSTSLEAGQVPSLALHVNNLLGQKE